jgi:hypothetical protein
MNTKYMTLAVAAMMVGLIVLGGGASAFAQAVPLSCSVASSGVVGQQVTFTATGGNGNYVWSSTSMTISNASGNPFTATFGTAGNHVMTVTSNGVSANCSVNISSAATGAVSCSPTVQNVNVGQQLNLTASGGNGVYTWAAPGIVDTSQTGSSGYFVNYGSAGTRIVVVTSGGSSATCTVNVLGTSVPVPPVIIPGLPNTGGGAAAL